MPYYDYKCASCGNVMLEQLRKYEEKTIKCESCGQSTASRLFPGKFNAHGLPNGHIGVRRQVNK